MIFKRIADDNDMPTERGTYRKILDYWSDYFGRKGQPNLHWAEVCCPECGRVAMIGANHKVLEDGTVQPSDVCPFPPCTFHQFIKLDDWARPCTPRRS